MLYKTYKRWKKILLLSLRLLTVGCIGAQPPQENSVFHLEKHAGHYYFHTTINGIPARCMLESGIPAMLISEGFFLENKDMLALDPTPGGGSMRFVGKSYEIRFMAEGRLDVGDALYDGPIFILDGEIGPKIPVQYLKNKQDSSSVVMVDIPGNSMAVMTRKALDAVAHRYESFPIRQDQSGRMPVVTAGLRMGVEGKDIFLHDDFIVDFGNASFLFLMRQNESVSAAIATHGIELQEARDKAGHVVGEGIYADGLTFCGKSFSGVSVGVTDRLASVREAGFLGLKFFTMPVILDFDGGKMLLGKLP